jgi:hypothetical protein
LNIILHPCPVFPNFLFTSSFPTNRLCVCLFSHTCHMPCPSHFPSFDTLIIFGEARKSSSCLLRSFIRFPFLSSL